MSVVFSLFPRNSALRRERLLSSLGLDDDGSASQEIGRPETGATCLLVDDGGVFRLHLPLLRTPTAARDLLPTLVRAADDAGGVWVGPIPGDPIAVWDALHEQACRELDPAEIPPHLPRAALLDLHAWLLKIALTPGAAGPLLAIDPPTRVVVGLPPAGPALLPPFDVLANVDVAGAGETRVFPVSRFGAPREDGFVAVEDAARVDLSGGEPLGEVRIVTPVEIVDDESLAG